MTGFVVSMIRRQRHAQRVRLLLAAAAGAAVATASVVLLGLSGWFIAGAALAGGAGASAAHAFNFLLPSAMIRLLAIVRTAARYLERVAGHDAALRALAGIRPRIFGAFAAGPPESALSVSAGEVSSRLVQDTDALQTVFIRMSNPWALGAGAASSILLAGLARPVAAVAVAGAMLLAVGLSLRVARRLATPAGIGVQRAAGVLKERLAAYEAAAPELRAYGLTAWAAREADAAALSLDRATVRLHQAGGWMLAALAGVTGLAVVTVVTVTAGAPVPLVALAALAAVTGVEAAGGLAAAFRQAGAADEAILRLEALTPSTAIPSPAPLAEPDLVIADALALAYPDRLAFVGASGAGKTTLIERLVGLRTPVRGEWRVGGQDLADLPTGSARGLFAYAAQDVRLIDGTVAENLRLARPDATHAELWTALDDAGLAERISAAPLGLDLPVGANGGRLSGGERRRLGLARAYLREAPWLVLDEPTEGLDAPLEALVLERLDRRLQGTGQGLILVSHRPAPVRLCGVVLGVEGLVGGKAILRERLAPAA